MISTKIPASHAITTAKWITRLAYLIALIGTVASYGTQVSLLLAYEVGSFSYVIPATIDILAICAALALQLPGLDATSRKIAGGILFVAVTVSVLANVTGGHNPIGRAAHAWPVIAYLCGEMLANRVRAYAARLAAQQDTPAPVVQVPMQPATIVPTVAAVTAPAIRRAVTRAHASGVRTGSHANCAHPSTASDRAKCRKAAALVTP